MDRNAYRLAARTNPGDLLRLATAIALALSLIVSSRASTAAEVKNPVASAHSPAVAPSEKAENPPEKTDEPQTDGQANPKAAERPAAKTNSNCLVGRFVYDGDPPERKKISAVREAAHALLPSLPADARIETLLVDKNKGIANVFVYVRSKDVPFDKTKASKDTVRVHVADGQFSPHAMTLQSSQTLHVENTLKKPINFRSRFWVNENVNFLIIVGGEHRTQLKPEPIPVRYSCDIYPWMHCWMLVTDHPYVATSDASGDFTIRDLPQGEWEFQVWHEQVGNLTTKAWPKGRFKFDVREGTNDLGTIEIEPDQIKARAKLDEEF